MLPDGQTVLFTKRPSVSWEEAHVDSIHIATKERKTLLTNAADARYSSTGHLVFIRNAALLAVAFDAARAEIAGSPVPLVAGVMQATNAGNGNDETGMAQFALSGSGALIYASGGIYPTPATSLVRVDRKGKETKLADIQGALFGVRLSPDGSRVAALKTQNGTRASDLWAYDLPSGTPTRLTSTGDASWPLFSPEGKSITYVQSGSNPGIYSLPTNGSGNPTRVMEPAKNAPGFSPASWSPDGKWLAHLQSVGNVSQLFVRPMPAPRESKQFAPSTFTMTHAEFSPDGRWMAYVSNESGASEVYVQAFPGPGEKRRISSSGGSQPAWSRNGRELFYFQQKGIAPNTTNAIVAVETSNAGGFRVGTPHVLFAGPYSGSTPLRSYDLTSDGQFIMVRQEGNPPDQKVTQLNVVLGWGQELKRRIPSSTLAH
jgi:eukaryotic-like serine/threonine-protein kinase